MLDHFVEGRLLPDTQSAYGAYNSTETAVLKLLSNILQAVDGGDLAVLALLDLSVVFEAVNHIVLLHRLDVSMGFGSTVHSWFRSYNTNQMQFVHFGASNSLNSNDNVMWSSTGFSNRVYSLASLYS